jgi:hypothetical protein
MNKAFRKILFMVRGAPARASCWRSNARALAGKVLAKQCPRGHTAHQLHAVFHAEWLSNARAGPPPRDNLFLEIYSSEKSKEVWKSSWKSGKVERQERHC